MDLMHIMILSLNALMEHESLLSKTSQFGRWEGWGPGVTGTINFSLAVVVCYA